jgi:hypothetical protein
LPDEAALEGGHLPLDALRPRQHLIACAGQQVAVAVTVEQFHAEPRLECLDPPRHRRVAHADQRARASNGPRPGEGEKVTHIIPVHELVSVATSARDVIDVLASRLLRFSSRAYSPDSSCTGAAAS